MQQIHIIIPMMEIMEGLWKANSCMAAHITALVLFWVASDLPSCWIRGFSSYSFMSCSNQLIVDSRWRIKGTVERLTSRVLVCFKCRLIGVILYLWSLCYSSAHVIIFVYNYIKIIRWIWMGDKYRLFK